MLKLIEITIQSLNFINLILKLQIFNHDKILMIDSEITLAFEDDGPLTHHHQK
jgi:hypothetical protein